MIDWAIFFGIASVLVFTDLLYFDRKLHQPGFFESAAKTAFYVIVAIAFGGWVWLTRGAEHGMQFFTGYMLEMSLSFDNVFVISLIFGALSIPRVHRSRVLFIGILSAIVLRGIFILSGAALVANFHWILNFFAAFLIFTGIKMLVSGEQEEVDIEKNRILRFLRRYVPLTENFHGKKFFTLGKATPLFVALVMVEITDVIFAVDSIPATFAVTTDPFIVFTSNIFAIVGLRSLFFVLEAMVHRFQYLGTALSVVLVFIGVKVLAAEFLAFHISTAVSLGIVLSMLLAGIVISLVKTRGQDVKA